MKSLLTFDTVGHRRMDIAVPPPHMRNSRQRHETFSSLNIIYSYTAVTRSFPFPQAYSFTVILAIFVKNWKKT